MNDHRWLYPWALGSVALGAASLLVPLYVVQLGGTPLDLGLLGAAAALVGAPSAVAWGRLADRSSNGRRIVVGSLLAVAVVLWALPALSTIPLVVAANAVLWLAFAAAGPVLTLLIVADAPERDWSREIALLNTYQGYGWAGGLLVGILWTAAIGRFVPPIAVQRSLFVVCGAVAVIAAAVLGRWMPAPSRSRLSAVDPGRVAHLLSVRRRNVRGATFVFAPTRLYWTTRAIHPRRLAARFTPTLAAYFLAATLFFTGFAAFFAPLPLYLARVGFSPDLVFGLYLVASVGSAAFYAGAGALSGRVDLRVLQGSALGLRSIAFPLVAAVGVVFSSTVVGTVLAVLLFLVVGLTWAVIAVTAGTIVTRLAPGPVRGEALGVYAALSTLATGIGSVAGGWIAGGFGYPIAFACAGGFVLVGGGFVVALRGISTGTASDGTAPVETEHSD